jgi:precorrin-3B C17-methyltransferase
MTARARAALEASALVAGYSLYVGMIPPELLRGKECVVTGMRRETDRCDAAVDAALAGTPTALVCSGDAGVYGMAGLVFELLERRGLIHRVPVEVVPGVPALCSAAALLGAPLMHDFACVSLSDLLTPWELIVRRVKAALNADFVLALYNPRSKGRSGHLAAVLELIREKRPAHTPVGLVRQAYRPEQETSAGTLEDFDPARADMLSIVFVGNSSTRLVGDKMVTPRGYFDDPRISSKAD